MLLEKIWINTDDNVRLDARTINLVPRRFEGVPHGIVFVIRLVCQAGAEFLYHDQNGDP